MGIKIRITWTQKFQLYHFKKGERKHILMESIARGLTDLEIQWVSGAFGGLDLNQEAVETPTVPDGVNVGICNGCHLNDVNRSTTGKIPNIAGQKKDYLLVQLNNFKSDQRTDFATSFMNGFVKTLTPEQFEKLSDYYSKLRVKNNDYGDYYKSEEPPEPTLPPVVTRTPGMVWVSEVPVTITVLVKPLPLYAPGASRAR